MYHAPLQVISRVCAASSSSGLHGLGDQRSAEKIQVKRLSESPVAGLSCQLFYFFALCPAVLFLDSLMLALSYTHSVGPDYSSLFRAWSFCIHTNLGC